MKQTTFIIALMFFCVTAISQDNAVDKYFQPLQQKHALDVTAVSSKMFNLFLKNKQGKEKDELAAVIKKLDALKVLSKEKPSNGQELFNSSVVLMPKEYESILTIKERSRSAQFFTKENKSGQITELVMIAWQWGRFMIVSLTGDIDLNDISRLSQTLDMQGLHDLKKSKNQN
jgi:hypothetical protein